MDLFRRTMTVRKPSEKEQNQYEFKKLTSTNELFDYIGKYIPYAKNNYNATQIRCWLSSDSQFGLAKTVRRGSEFVKCRKLWVLRHEYFGIEICVYKNDNVFTSSLFLRMTFSKCSTAGIQPPCLPTFCSTKTWMGNYMLCT